jgi:hypothetical protein
MIVADAAKAKNPTNPIANIIDRFMAKPPAIRFSISYSKKKNPIR